MKLTQGEFFELAENRIEELGYDAETEGLITEAINTATQLRIKGKPEQAKALYRYVYGAYLRGTKLPQKKKKPLKFIKVESVTLDWAEQFYDDQIPKTLGSFREMTRWIRENIDREDFESTKEGGYIKHGFTYKYPNDKENSLRIDIGYRDENPFESDNIFGDTFLIQYLFALLLAKFGNDADKKRYVPIHEGWVEGWKKYDGEVSYSQAMRAVETASRLLKDGHWGDVVEESQAVRDFHSPNALMAYVEDELGSDVIELWKSYDQAPSEPSKEEEGDDELDDLLDEIEELDEQAPKSFDQNNLDVLKQISEHELERATEPPYGVKGASIHVSQLKNTSAEHLDSLRNLQLISGTTDVRLTEHGRQAVIDAHRKKVDQWIDSGVAFQKPIIEMLDPYQRWSVENNSSHVYLRSEVVAWKTKDGTPYQIQMFVAKNEGERPSFSVDLLNLKTRGIYGSVDKKTTERADTLLGKLASDHPSAWDNATSNIDESTLHELSDEASFKVGLKQLMEALRSKKPSPKKKKKSTKKPSGGTKRKKPWFYMGVVKNKGEDFYVYDYVERTHRKAEDARKAVIPDYEDIRAFYVKQAGGYFIYEETTGQKLADGKTLKGAKAEAKRKMDSAGREEVGRLIRLGQDSSLSPRYRKAASWKLQQQ